MLELHRARWTPLKAGMKMRSKLGFLYEVERVMGENVMIKRIDKKRKKQLWFITSIRAVQERLTVVP